MKICSKCGAQLQDDTRFCTNCGTPVEEAPVNQEQAAPDPSASHGAHQSQTAYQEQGTYQNQNTYQDQNAYQNQSAYQNDGAYQGQSAYRNPYQSYDYAPYGASQYDHTAEFDAKDISDNKVICMLAYLMGAIGIIIALLVNSSSPYAAFHVRQALKFTVVSILTGIVTLVLCWTIIVPIAAIIFMLVLFVVKIICFFQICSGKAIEPYIIRSFGFLK